jgi:hypothetical protein
MHVRVVVTSSRPTEVSIDLRPGAATRPLIAHALRVLDNPDADRGATRARIAGVVFEPGSTDGKPPTVRIEIPKDHAAGTYHGLLIDPDSNLPAGTLSVRVLEDREPGSKRGSTP